MSAKQGRNTPLVAAEQRQEERFHEYALVRAASRESASAAELRPAAAGVARTTRRAPLGSVWSRSAMRCWSRRRTWLRVTAGPTARPTTNPTLRSVASRATRAWSTRPAAPTRRPARVTEEKSARWCSRADRESTKTQAERLARPLRRRDARIARPARVRIRSRKPCVLARRRLFGWNVRLLTRISHGDWLFSQDERCSRGAASLAARLPTPATSETRAQLTQWSALCHGTGGRQARSNPRSRPKIAQTPARQGDTPTVGGETRDCG